MHLPLKLATNSGTAAPGAINHGCNVDLVLQGTYHSRVTCMSLGPLEPVLLTGHEDGTVNLWDYTRQAIMISVSAPSLVEEHERDRASMLKAAEKGGGYRAPLTSGLDKLIKGSANATEAAITHAKWINADARLSKLMLSHSAGRYCTDVDHAEVARDIFSAHLPQSGRVFTTHAAVVCDGRVILLDYSNPEAGSREIRSSDMDNARAVCVDVFEALGNTFLLIGCSDGFVRTFDLVHWRIVAPKMGGHKSVEHIWCATVTEGWKGSSINGERPDLDAEGKASQHPQFGDDDKGSVLVVTAGSEGKIQWWKLAPHDEFAAEQPLVDSYSASLMDLLNDSRSDSEDGQRSASTPTMVTLPHVKAALSEPSSAGSTPSLSRRAEKKAAAAAAAAASSLPSFFSIDNDGKPMQSITLGSEIISLAPYRCSGVAHSQNSVDSWAVVGDSHNSRACGRLVCSLADRTVVVFSLTAGRELFRMRLQKQAFVRCAGVVHPSLPHNSIWGMWKDDARMFWSHPSSPEVQRELLDSNDFPNSLKKNKLCEADWCVLNTSIAAVATRQGGVFVVRLSPRERFSGVVSGFGRSGVRDSKRKLLYFGHEETLYTVSISTPLSSSSGCGASSLSPSSCVTARPLRVAHHLKNMKGRLSVSTSPNSRFLCVQNTTNYAIYDLGSRDKKDKEMWTLVDEGSCLQFAWGAIRTSDGKRTVRYAILVIPVKADTEEKTPRKKSKAGRKTSSNSANALPVIQVKEIRGKNGEDDPEVAVVSVSDDLITKLPVTRLFSGLLLGVVYEPDLHGLDFQLSGVDSRKISKGGSLSLRGKMSPDSTASINATSSVGAPAKSSVSSLRAVSKLQSRGSMPASVMHRKDQSHSFDGPVPRGGSVNFGAGAEEGSQSADALFQFLSWKDNECFPFELQDVESVVWDPLERYCCIVLSDELLVFRIRPSFTLMCAWKAVVTSALFGVNSLVYTTPTELMCIFPGANNFPPVLLASTNPLTAVAIRSTLHNSTSNVPWYAHLLPTAGGHTVVKCDDNEITMMGQHFSRICVPVHMPRVKFFFATAAASMDEAMEWYVRSMSNALCVRFVFLTYVLSTSNAARSTSNRIVWCNWPISCACKDSHSTLSNYKG